MNEVNLTRLKNCMRRAKAGEELTIGFLGGSITQGSLATEPENMYAWKVFEWWKEQFPEATFHYVNAGIGGTSSHYGVSRAISDLLVYRPDFVVVDFSVNDEPNNFYQETYEGVLRKLLKWESKPAVLLLNNVYYDTGKTAQEQHNELAKWYQIPFVSVKDTIYKEMQEGKYQRDELTSDGLHPNDKGHGLLAEKINEYLDLVKQMMDVEEKENEMPSPMTKNAYENAKRLTILNSSPQLEGFVADADEKSGHLDSFKNGWIGKKAGDIIRFEVDASCVAIQYRKTIRKPARIAKLILDGDHEHAVILDGNFDEDWGDCQYLEAILHHGEKKVHTLEIEIMSDEETQATPFYLMSLIIA